MPRGVYRHKPMTDEAKKYLSKFWMGKKKSEKHRENIRRAVTGERNPNFGKKLSDEEKERLHAARRGKPSWNKGKKCPQLATRWRGGISTENNRLRHSLEYRQWRTAVFERDDYTCQACQKRGGELNADHIKPFSLYPDARFNIDNGRTLCVSCHKKTPTYARQIEVLRKREQNLNKIYEK